MKKRQPESIEKEEEFLGLTGHKIKITKTQSGIVQFSTFEVDIPDAEKLKLIIKEHVGLDWQRYSELQVDHGQSAICETLDPLGLYILSENKRSELLEEIKTKIPKHSWSNLQAHFRNLKNENSNDLIDILIVAGWVDLFQEPFQEIWLAAMAKHAYYIEENDFAFGYLIALLDQKKNSEQHFLRGKQTLKSATLGGLAKSSSTKPQTQKTLTEISRLITTGHTASRASELAFKNGFGSSVGGNKKLWTRNRK
jgi:hypothetical protein